MKSFEEMLSQLDPGLFAKINSQTTPEDKTSLLAPFRLARKAVAWLQNGNRSE